METVSPVSWHLALNNSAYNSSNTKNAGFFWNIYGRLVASPPYAITFYYLRNSISFVYSFVASFGLAV